MVVTRRAFLFSSAGLLVLALLALLTLYPRWDNAPEIRPSATVQAGDRVDAHLQRCHAFNGSDLYTAIDQSVARVRTITRTDVEDAFAHCTQIMRSNCVRVQVVGGRMYLSGEQSSVGQTLQATKLMLYRVQQLFGSALPDVDLVLVSSDGTYESLPPHFVVVATCAARDTEHHRFLMPDWSHWAYTFDGIEFYEDLRSEIAQRATNLTWQGRTERLLYRGNSIYPERQNLMAWAQRLPADIDAQSAILFSDPTSMRLSDQCASKYLAYTPGITYSARLKYFLHCGSVVVIPRDNRWEEWFYPLLKPWQHFVPGPPAWNTDEMSDLMPTLRAQDERMATIGQASQQLARTYLGPEGMYCYWYRLLNAYSKLQTFTVVRRSDSWSLEFSLARVP